jgi:hypothetical protein
VPCQNQVEGFSLQRDEWSAKNEIEKEVARAINFYEIRI